MHKFVVAAALMSSIALAGCDDDPTYYPTEVPQAQEGVIPGVEVTNARMVLAPVEGNPAAIYFDVSYSGDENFVIRGAEVTNAASAEVHNTYEYNREMTMGDAGPQPVAKGSSLTFEPGAKHIMAMEPSSELKPGGTAEVFLIAAGGHKHRFEAEIRAAGEER